MNDNKEEDSVSLYTSDDDDNFLLLCVPPTVLSNRNSADDANLPDFCKRLMKIFPSSFFVYTPPVTATATAAATTTIGGSFFTYSSTQQRYDADIRRIRACFLRMLFAAFYMVEGGSYGGSSATPADSIPPAPSDYTLVTLDDLQSCLIDLFRPTGDFWKNIILMESDCTLAVANAPLMTLAGANLFVPHKEDEHGSHNYTFRFYPRRLQTVMAATFYHDIFGLNNIHETHYHPQQDNYFYPPFLHVDNSIETDDVTHTTTTGVVVRNHLGAVMETAYDCLISLSRQVDQMILRYTDEGKKTTKFWIQNINMGYINDKVSFQFFPIGNNALEMIQRAATSAALSIYPRSQNKMMRGYPIIGSNTIGISSPITIIDPTCNESMSSQDDMHHYKQHSKAEIDNKKHKNCLLEDDNDDDIVTKRKPLKRLRRGTPLTPCVAPSVITTASCSEKTQEVSIPHIKDDLKNSANEDEKLLFDSVEHAWAVAENHYNFSDLEQIDSLSRTASSDDDG
jgi:extradiol dioxygenase family protein